MPSSLYIPFLLGGMIITGSSNSLWGKFQDMQCVENCSDPDPSKHILYEQPVWQTLQMFAGEMLCFLPILYTYLLSHYNEKRQAIQLPVDEPSPEIDDVLGKPGQHVPEEMTGAKVLLFWIPALCDLIATTLMNVGLIYTPVSIFQMTRGALVMFVGVFSVVFLRHRLWLYQWLSLVIVMLGVGIVGYSGSLVSKIIDAAPKSLGLRGIGGMEESGEEPELALVLVGVFLILFAQVFTAIQFVVEEKIMARYSIAPLIAVGYEGLFGTLSILLLIPLLSIPFPPFSNLSHHPFFDLPRGFTQSVSNPAVFWSGIATAISIAFFNFFGLSVTRHVSSTARSLVDTCRTLAIWVVSLALGWEWFVVPESGLQVVGFGMLVYGTFLFNNLVKVPAFLPGPPSPSQHACDGNANNEDDNERVVSPEISASTEDGRL